MFLPYYSQPVEQCTVGTLLPRTWLIFMCSLMCNVLPAVEKILTSLES